MACDKLGLAGNRGVWLACALALLAGTARPAAAASHSIRIKPGAGEFTFVDEHGEKHKKLRVFTYVPPEADPRTAPILFAMHGHSRTAEGYRDHWAKRADKYGFMVFAPLFDEENWGHGQYSYASVVDEHGKIRDRKHWSFMAVEHLFDAIKHATGNQQPRYMIFGFSEGGQFVHRLVLLMPNARYSRAIVGSPGWYTMPTFDQKFPYGLRGSPATVDSLKTSLGRDVVILLGTADNDPNHHQLRKTREAEAQGPHRLARGHTFFNAAKHQAHALHTPFGWHLQEVEGAAHHPNQVTKAAAQLLMER